MIKNVTILGPGLLGGSIGIAAQKAGYEVVFWGRSEEKLKPVSVAGFVVSTSVRESIANADLIIMAIPVPYMRDLAVQMVEAGLRPDQIVTDVGSVKGSVLKAMFPVLNEQGYTFIGSHPMAGAETQGFEAARAELLHGATCIVTPDPFTSATKLEMLKRFWDDLGMKSCELESFEHDQVISRVSHIPHVLASVCAHVALPQAENGAYAGGGLRDTSRVASGDAALWAGILSENKEATGAHLDEAILRLMQYAGAIKEDDVGRLEQLLLEDKNRRDSFY